MNKKNKLHQDEKKSLEQKKLLLKMQKEIKNLEFEIKHSRLVNFKIGTIRNLKIGARATQLIAPYVLTASLTAGAFAFLGDIPFYGGDKWKIYAKVMTEFDNIGNIRYEEQYDDFANSDNRLIYYSKWQQSENGLYTRSVVTYSIKKQTYEDIIKLFNQENIDLEDVLGSPISNIKETKNNLTEEELQEESLVKAIIYNKDENNYIIHQETVGENIALSILYVLLTALGELVIGYFRTSFSSFDFSESIREIKRKHKSIDIEVLAKKLELKKDNYNLIMR